MTDTVLIFDTATAKMVAAVCHPMFTKAVVRATEAAWAPHRQRLDPSAEHAHWNWSRKAYLLTRPHVRCIGIEHDGEMQGLLLLSETGFFARYEPDEGLPLVFVEYLEVAPWNGRMATPLPRFRQVGRKLMMAAADLSEELGYDGRIGLYSLPQSEPFYGRACGMRAGGRDDEYDGLMYYEMTAQESAAFRQTRDDS